MGIKFFVSPDNPRLAYFPGQNVSGKVCLDLDRELKIEGIQMELLGYSQVHFYEFKKAQNDNPNMDGIKEVDEWFSKAHYKSNDDYFRFKLSLIENTSQKIILPAGLSVFPFSFKLPEVLPSSYSGKHGRILYLLKAKLKGTQRKIKIPFTINGILDLNYERGAKEPSETLAFKSIGCCFCKQGPISLNIKIPRIGYVPGENIRFLVEINNSTRQNITSMEMSLLQRVTYIAKSGGGQINSLKRKEKFPTSRKLFKIIGPGVSCGDSEFWDSENSFKIPAIPPTTRFSTCKNIQVEYFLFFEGKIDSAGFNMYKEIPIIIGTIPFISSTFQELPLIPLPRPQLQPFNTYPMQMPQPELVDLPPAYQDLPPPSYSKVMNPDKNEYYESPSAPTDVDDFEPNYIIYR